MKPLAHIAVALLVAGGILHAQHASRPQQDASSSQTAASPQATRSVLVLHEGAARADNLAWCEARQLAMLLGHFNVRYDVQSIDAYRTGMFRNVDVAAFIGHSLGCAPPAAFMRDVAARSRTFLWINTGMLAFSRAGHAERFGFEAVSVDTSTAFEHVNRGREWFVKGENNLTRLRILDAARVQTIATAHAKRSAAPYIIRSGEFWYVADSPFSYATEKDRYLLFADLLHDILGEQHATSHSAIVRIEDVHPFEDPDRLRAVADVLHARGIPFLVGVVPFYIDPSSGLRLRLSDKPDLVDALHYMVRNGATLVMHGATHQYKGVTAADYEFWDVNRHAPIRDETLEGDRAKMLMGLDEFMRNGLHPLLWETPHYTGSDLAYDAAATIFSSAIEQRLVAPDETQSQFFPYVIRRDLHGQWLYPENLGYVPFDPDDPVAAHEQVSYMIDAARTNLAVRDGFASFFYHSFVPLDNLERLVDSIRTIGYTFIDVRRDAHQVRLPDRLIATGRGTATLTLTGQYLREYHISRAGEITRLEVGHDRVKGSITVRYDGEGGIYVATPTEIRERTPSLWERVRNFAQRVLRAVVSEERRRTPAVVAVLWDSTATGGAMLDQRSFENAFTTLSIPVRRVHVGARLDLARSNLLVVPYGSIEHLSDASFSAIIEWIRRGGSCITDGRTEFSKELGIRTTGTRVSVSRIRDQRHPEEAIVWRTAETLEKFALDEDDALLAVDEESEAPVVIGRSFGAGRFVYFGCRFDPVSGRGDARFPFLASWMQKYFDVHPVVRRDALELFFDPGFRATVSVEDLVKQWVRHGVRAIHVAGWHVYPTYTYDYEKLVRLCHGNGMLVYAWLEPPQVSQKFWKDHPEWREKNVRGDDARPSWRYPMAMSDEACVRAMLGEYRTLLERHDFDGVNIAEVYCESGVGGPDEPVHFTPMHPTAREAMRRRIGFDPAELLAPSARRYWKRAPEAWKRVEDYRVEIAASMHARLLALADGIRAHRRGFDVVVTALDNLGNPELRRTQGVDIESILALRHSHEFLLVVEDPLSRWSDAPERYRDIAARYAAFGHAVGLDLNILAFRSAQQPTQFPTLVQTGTEAFELLAIASRAAPRVVTYAESSINPQDLPLLGHAAASVVDIVQRPGGLRLHAPVECTLHLDDDRRAVLIDGRIRHVHEDGRVLIPAGTHEVDLGADPTSTFASAPTPAGLLSLTGTLLSLEEEDRAVRFTYESVARCYATFNKHPIGLAIDGVDVPLVVLDGSGRYAIQLPPGRHVVHVTTRSTLAWGIDFTSLWSSSLIVLFGAAAFLLLMIFHLTVRVRRMHFRSVPWNRSSNSI